MAGNTHADDTLSCIGARGIANKRITPGPHTKLFGQAREGRLLDSGCQLTPQLGVGRRPSRALGGGGIGGGVLGGETGVAYGGFCRGGGPVGHLPVQGQYPLFGLRCRLRFSIVNPFHGIGECRDPQSRACLPRRGFFLPLPMGLSICLALDGFACPC